ncbi:hypothetical protein [Stutzerimonas chloritidismutans]|uniref:hypothetical protein n=1 Tax=Stutzerimonas chloritidismutans TaxID=203192 RepID=UPI00384F7863
MLDLLGLSELVPRRQPIVPVEVPVAMSVRRSGSTWTELFRAGRLHAYRHLAIGRRSSSVAGTATEPLTRLANSKG